jgi:hypothetical protein
LLGKNIKFKKNAVGDGALKVLARSVGGEVVGQRGED